MRNRRPIMEGTGTFTCRLDISYPRCEPLESHWSRNSRPRGVQPATPSQPSTWSVRELERLEWCRASGRGDEAEGSIGNHTRKGSEDQKRSVCGSFYADRENAWEQIAAIWLGWGSSEEASLHMQMHSGHPDSLRTGIARVTSQGDRGREIRESEEGASRALFFKCRRGESPKCILVQSFGHTSGGSDEPVQQRDVTKVRRSMLLLLLVCGPACSLSVRDRPRPSPVLEGIRRSFVLDPF